MCSGSMSNMKLAQAFCSPTLQHKPYSAVQALLCTTQLMFVLLGSIACRGANLSSRGANWSRRANLSSRAVLTSGMIDSYKWHNEYMMTHVPFTRQGLAGVATSLINHCKDANATEFLPIHVYKQNYTNFKIHGLMIASGCVKSTIMYLYTLCNFACLFGTRKLQKPPTFGI